MRAFVLQDWAANAHSTRRIQRALVLFRLSQYLAKRGCGYSTAAKCVAALYRSYGLYLSNFELPVATRVGPRLVVWHGYGTVIHPSAVIGADVCLRQQVTIGNRGSGVECPVIEDGVDIGVGATILGPVHIGAGASIGAHCLVTFDVPAGARVRAPRSALLNTPTLAD